jgi:hypothetical protein
MKLLALLRKTAVLAMGLAILSGVGACDSKKSQEADASMKKLSAAHCRPQSGKPSHPCRISLYKLIAAPAENTSSLVSVSGYLSRGSGGSLILFVDRESSEYAIRENGVHISAKHRLEPGPIDRYVQVIGKFSAGNPYAESILDGTQSTIGFIEADSVEAHAGDAWSCSQQGERENDQHYSRLDPCPFENSRRKAGPPPPLPPDP